jgi:serine/threonine protein kinase
VHACTHRASGLRAAVKRLDKGKTKRSVFEAEVEAMRLCRGHPGVVSLYGVYEGSGGGAAVPSAAMVMEMVEKVTAKAKKKTVKAALNYQKKNVSRSAMRSKKL